MAGHRRRLIDAFQAAQSAAQTEVHVFEVGFEAFVELAGLFKQVPANQRGGGTSGGRTR